MTHSISEANESATAPKMKGRQLVMMSLGSAIGTGLFLGSGRTISLAGPSILLVYLIIGFFSVSYTHL